MPNIDEKLAQSVANGLGLQEKIVPLQPARKPQQDIKTSKPLSIELNPPKSFEGRKVGILLTDGADDSIYEALIAQIKAEKASFEIIALTVGGIITKKGKRIPADQKLEGAPSVLYDASAIVSSSENIKSLSKHPSARQFVSDAFNHLKCIGYTKDAVPLLEKSGILSDLDEGCIEFTAETNHGNKFISACRKIRFWSRESKIMP